MKEAWKTITRHVNISDPEASGKFLGCDHKCWSKILPAGGDPWQEYQSKDLKGPTYKLKGIEYDMEPFFAQCVSRYQELAKLGKLPHAGTPFIDEAKADTEWFAAQFISKADADKTYNKTAALLASKAKIGTVETGELKENAARILMKILYGARMARWDLLRPVAVLASRITKWDRWDDKRIHRLVCYVNSSLKVRMCSYRRSGESLDDLKVNLHVDADFAGDQKDSKSTSGVFHCVESEFSFCPLSGQSKKQTCVSHSTPEAEIVAADHGIRSEGIPSLDLLSLILKRDFGHGGVGTRSNGSTKAAEPAERLGLNVHEDNSTALHVMKIGKSPALRHVHRTHRVSISWSHQMSKERVYDL